MDLSTFCRELPKVELHAHLNGSLSRSTMLQLKRYHADTGIDDKTNAFFDEFQIGAGDTRNLADCFQVFGIAHTLTSSPEALALATSLTLQEFQDDGCCYIELRSTPRETPHMNKKQYINTIIQAIQKASLHLTMTSRLIVSINRNAPTSEVDQITNIAIESYKAHPDIVVGIELSGNPTVGNFRDFVPALNKARNAGLKVTLHCGEVYNPKEVVEMLKFKPERIGHGTCIHPRLGGLDDAWNLLCTSKIPVEVCLTSNVNTKSTPNYESHHFKDLFEAEVPVIICVQLQHNKATMGDISDYASPKDSELQDFLLAEKQKAQFHAQIHEFNDFCWEKCVDKPGAKLDSRTETCISNCVERFIDVSLLITNRFAQMLEKGGGMH